MLLARAKSKAADLSVRWVEGDARDFDLGERFRLIFQTGNAIQAFVSNAEQAAVLRRAQAHLDVEGLFAFETRSPLLPNQKTREGFSVTLETLDEEVQPAILRQRRGVRGARDGDAGLTSDRPFYVARALRRTRRGRVAGSGCVT